jgi:hypothetical protein
MRTSGSVRGVARKGHPYLDKVIVCSLVEVQPC